MRSAALRVRASCGKVRTGSPRKRCDNKDLQQIARFLFGASRCSLLPMTESKSMILGCAGKSLNREEVRFYRGECPWGFILFARNVSEPEQIRDLVAEMRD